MKKLRKEDLSLHHYIRFNVLNEFIETDTNATLRYNEEQSTPPNSMVYDSVTSMLPIPTSLGRGWSYIDTYGDITEQQNSVIVYDSVGSVISGAEYMVDYIDGRVITSGTVVPATVTYKFFYVSVVNEWEDVYAAGVPVVSIHLDGFEKEGFQLGGGRKPIRRGHFHIFATNQGERDDLKELLYDGIYNKCVPNQNWPKGTMLDWNGTFSDHYEYELILYHSNLHCENVRAVNLHPPLLGGIPRTDITMLSDLNRYRARIDFDMFHFEEG
jgi:hypothetical protein